MINHSNYYPPNITSFSDKYGNNYFVLYDTHHLNFINVEQTKEWIKKLSETVKCVDNQFLKEVSDRFIKISSLKLDPSRYLEEYDRDDLWHEMDGDKLLLEQEKRKEKDRKRKPIPGDIYVVKDNGTGYYKIGMSGNVRQRIKALNTSTPCGIETILIFGSPDCALDENNIHKMFSDKRISGEWFELDDKDIDKIKQHRLSNTEDIL
jgi:hypothetical protein